MYKTYSLKKLIQDNENQYQVDDVWIDMERTTEIIEVAGSEPIVIEVRETHHGPVVSDRSFPINLISEEGESTFREEARIKLPNDFAVSLSWSALVPGETFVGIREFNYASNWEEFREATREVSRSCSESAVCRQRWKHSISVTWKITN